MDPRSVSYREELSRAQSLSSLSIAGLEVQVMEDQVVLPRKVQRKDMPVCWLDQAQVKSRQKPDKQRSQHLDIISRLQVRPYTRHLARYILTYMREEDMAVRPRKKNLSSINHFQISLHSKSVEERGPFPY